MENQEFFIKVEDGSPVGFPFLIDNLRQVGVDPAAAGSGYFPFKPATEFPRAGRHEVSEEVIEFDGSTVFSKLIIRPMTSEEIAQLPPDPLMQIPGSAPDALE